MTFRGNPENRSSESSSSAHVSTPGFSRSNFVTSVVVLSSLCQYLPLPLPTPSPPPPPPDVYRILEISPRTRDEKENPSVGLRSADFRPRVSPPSTRSHRPRSLYRRFQKLLGPYRFLYRSQLRNFTSSRGGAILRLHPGSCAGWMPLDHSVATALSARSKE